MTKRRMVIEFETQDDVDLVALVDRIRDRITSGICTGPEVWVRVAGISENDQVLFDISDPLMVGDAAAR